MVSARRRKQNKKLLRQLNETLKDLIIGNTTNADIIENETIEPQTSGPVFNWGKSAVGENSVSQIQALESDIANKIRKEAHNAVTVVENWVHDATLPAMDTVIILRVQIAVRSITVSSNVDSTV